MVARRGTVAQDLEIREKIQDARVPAGDAVAEATGPLGKEWLHGPLAGALVLYLRSRGAGMGSALPAVASAAAEIASRALDRTPPHRTPPPGHPQRHKPSFPSGHANETSAVALTSAYVLAREELLPAAPAFIVAAALSIASAFGRLYLDRHWASDTAGGTLLGISIASACAAMYEVKRND